MESRTKRLAPDRSKIDLDQPKEVKYWIRQLGVSTEELRSVIDKVGNAAATVRKEIETQRAAK